MSGRHAAAVARGAAINLAGNVIGVLEPLLLVLIARVYGADTLGLFLVSTSSIALLLRLGVVGIDKGLLRHVPMAASAASPNAALASVLSTGLKIVILVSIATAVVTAVSPGLLSRAAIDQSDALRWTAWMALALPGEAVMQYFLFALRGRKRMAPFVVVRNLVFPMTMIVATLVVIATGVGPIGLIAAYVVAAWVGAVAAAIAWRREFRDISSTALWAAPFDRDLAAFSWPQGLTDLLNYSLGRVDIVMLGFFFPSQPELAGVYGIASQLAAVVKKPRIAIDVSLSPVLSELFVLGDRDALRETYQRVSRWILQLFLLTAGVVSFGAALAMSIPGDDFPQFWYAVPILAAGRYFNSAFGPAQTALLMAGRSKLELANNMAINVGNIALNVLLIPRWGILGAAVATSVSLSVFNVVRVLQVHWLLRIGPPVGAVLKITLAATIAGFPPAMVLSLGPSDRWYSLAAAAMFIAFYPAVLWMLGMGDDMRDAWRVVRKGRRRTARGEH